MAETESRAARLKEFLKTPEGRQKIADRFADVPPEEIQRFVKMLTRFQRATARWDEIRLGPDGQALFEMPGGDVLFEPGDDWFFRPFYEGSCRYEALVGTDTLDLVDITRMNFLHDVREDRKQMAFAKEPTKLGRSGQKTGPKFPDRDVAIRRGRDTHPPPTVIWEEFATLIRDDAKGWRDRKKLNPNRGFGTRAIQEAYKKVCSANDVTNS